jgi:suppressor of G2 allele of SKP1
LDKVDADDLSREVTVQEIPNVEVPSPTQQSRVTELDTNKDGKKPTTAEIPKPTPAPTPAGVLTPPSKIRHEWYQTPTHVVISLFVKGVPKDKATVEITESSVSITLHFHNHEALKLGLAFYIIPTSHR